MRAGKILYITLIFVGFACHVNAQKRWALKVSAEEAMARKDWYGAQQYYMKLYQIDTSKLKLKYSYAEACRLNIDVDLALKLYTRLAAVDKGEKYPLAFYWSGQLLKNKQLYAEAKKWFVKFNKLGLKPDKYEYYLKKALLEEDACDRAQVMVKNPIKIQTEHLKEPVNSKVSEYAPFEKDSILYFSSLRGAENPENTAPVYNKIYRIESRNSKWLRVKLLDTTFNNPRSHNANTCYSADFKTMIISRCNAINASEYTCNLYITRLVNNKWQVPQAMGEPINQPSLSTTQANFGTIDGKTVLFFASNRPGGEGGLDIWYSVMKSDGSFDTPVNAGKKINTPDDEITPWYISDKNLLYFSSTYHKGLGGYDIFKSEFKDKQFNEPENAGFPINSSYNDIYYSVNKTGSKIYLSSNRVGSMFDGKLNCCNDIYRFNIDTIPAPRPNDPPPVVVKKDTTVVLMEQMKLLVPLTLYFHNDEPDPRTKNTSTTKSYETTFNEYKHLIGSYADAYSKDLKGDERKAAINEINSFFADSLDAGFEDLKRFCSMLQKVLLNNETVRITFKGYCSPLASTDYNVCLAKRRVSSLRNYFNSYSNGWFLHYINNPNEHEGKIIFDEVDVGELPVSKASDDFKDKRNSVYSPSAAGERKIQILAVSFE